MVLVQPGPDRLLASRRAHVRRRLIRGAAGILAVVLLVASVRTITSGFEQQSRETIRAALDQNDMGWVQLHVEGRRAQLKGDRPGLGYGGKALDVTRQARCSFLMVEVACVRAVSADFGDLEPGRTVNTDA